MATVIGGSCAFTTPIGTPANTMVLSVGGYRFMDYIKAGLPPGGGLFPAFAVSPRSLPCSRGQGRRI